MTSSGAPARRGATRGLARELALELLAVAALVGLVVAAHDWGGRLYRRGEDLFLAWPPFFARFHVRWNLNLIGATAFAAAVVAAGPEVARRVRWRWLLVVGWATALGWTVILALADGPLAHQLARDDDYQAMLPFVRDHGLGAYFRLFHDRDLLSSFPVHVRSHPAGMVTLFRLMEQIGLRGSGWRTALVLAGGAVVVPAALVAARELFGESSTRKVAPFLVLMPSAVWFGTTPDGFFAGVVAVSIAAYVVGCRRDSRLAFAVAGVAAATAVSFTYGAVPLLVCTAVAGLVWKRRLVGSAIWIGGIAAVALTWRIAGFDLVQGFSAVRTQYDIDIGQQARPYSYFVWSNLTVVALAVGPAVLVALVRLRGRCWLALAPVLAALVLADLSGLSKGEVERIWLPFYPWLTLATFAFVGLHVNARRLHLACQAGTGIVLQLLFLGPW
ncbi:MAG: hypothetical protein ACXV8G_09595 [Acidimicrobiales bacterium]